MKTNIAVGLLTVALAATAQANLITIGESSPPGPFAIQDGTGLDARTLGTVESGTIEDVKRVAGHRPARAVSDVERGPVRVPDARRDDGGLAGSGGAS